MSLPHDYRSFPDSLNDQFVLSVRSERTPIGPTTQIGSVHLAGDCKITSLFDSFGVRVGFFLGQPADLKAGTGTTGEIHLALALGDDIDEFVEHGVYSVVGSYLFVLDLPGARRLYLDACGSKSAVWQDANGWCASTGPALLGEHLSKERFDSQLWRDLDVEHDGWFPAGLTAHAGISRILPNFYLDLDRRLVNRHWPRAPIAMTDDPRMTCAQLVQAASDVLNFYATKDTLTATLTAGNESRLLTSIALRNQIRADYVTVAGPTSDLDVWMAERLAARFDLDHRTLDLKMSSDAQAAEWLSQAGYCVGGYNPWTYRTMRHAVRTKYFISGLGGEIGRGFLWRRSDQGSDQIAARDLCRRLKLAPEEPVLTALDEWIKTLPDVEFHTELDLAYIELRMGPWAFPPSYVFSGFRPIFPLIGRRQFQLMMSLPLDWRLESRGTNQMITESIRSTYPELLEFPINRYGSIRDLFVRLKRGASDPRRALRAVRKRAPSINFLHPARSVRDDQ